MGKDCGGEGGNATGDGGEVMLPPPNKAPLAHHPLFSLDAAEGGGQPGGPIEQKRPPSVRALLK